jgi:hypothetical protein
MRSLGVVATLLALLAMASCRSDGNKSSTQQQLAVRSVDEKPAFRNLGKRSDSDL